MQAALSYPGSQRWLAPALLAIIVPLLFAALPGEPLQILAKDAGLLKHTGSEIATLRLVRTGFQQAQQAAPDGQTQTGRMAVARRALSGMAGEDGPAGAGVAALRDAIAAYDRALTHANDVQRYAEPATQSWTVGAAANGIEPALSRLQADDEARLQEPLQAMRLAAAALRLERDPRQAEQVSRWAAVFAARLDDMAIPPDTRTRLKARLASYEHAVLVIPDASLRQRNARETAQAGQLVETALATAEHVLTAEWQHRNHAFEAARKGFGWSFVAALGASLLIVGGGVFGRTAVDHGVVRAWHPR